MVRNKSQTFSLSERKTLIQAQKTIAEVQIKFVPFKFCGQVIWVVKANGFIFPNTAFFVSSSEFPWRFCRVLQDDE